MIIDIKKEVYQSLSESEKKVIDFLNRNEQLIPELSITKIAEKPLPLLPRFQEPFKNAVSQASANCATKFLNKKNQPNQPTRPMLSIIFWQNHIVSARRRSIQSALQTFIKRSNTSKMPIEYSFAPVASLP